MIDIQTSAPGKVIIAGEYAVLDGAPAICMAVDRRAFVSLATSHAECHNVLAPGYSQTAGRFRADEKTFEWLSGEAEFDLLTAVWIKVAPELPDKLDIVLDSNEFVDATTSSKIGIGSSAALVVALTAALDLAAGGGRSIYRVATAAHSDFQGGSGSGADIACSVTGGLIEFRMGNEPDRALQWPDGLHYAMLWSGVAAQTGDKLQRLAKVDAATSRAALATAAEAVATAWHNRTAVKILAALRSYTEALRRFDVDHELGIFDAGHAELADKAASAGVVYKPCGAGGGDLGIVLADDAKAVNAFVEMAGERGFSQQRLALEATGLRREGDRL